MTQKHIEKDLFEFRETPRTRLPAFRFIRLGRSACWIIWLLCAFARATELPQPVPVLLLPHPQSAAIVEHPSFAWTLATDVASYEIEISRDASFTDVLVRDQIEIPRYVPSKRLPLGENFWRVRTRAATQLPGQWSKTSTYRISAPARTYSIAADATLAQMQQTLEAAAAHAPAVVRFAANATYRIKPQSQAFALRDAHDLIIDGNGAMFVIEEPTAGFLTLDHCTRITVRGFAIDYDPLPHSVGEITGIDESGGKVLLQLRPAPGYPAFDAPHMLANWSWGVLLDPEPGRRGRMKPNSRLGLNFEKKQLLRDPNDPNLFRVRVGSAVTASHFTLGDRVIIFARQNGANLFTGRDCTDVTYENITVFACPAMHFSYLRGTDLKVLNCREQRKDHTRWFAGNADGVHARANLVGPWIEGCTISAIGDDGVALYNKGIAVTEQLDRERVRVADAFMDLQSGDSFTIWNPRAGMLIGGERSVRAVARDGAGWMVTFAPALPAGTKLVAVAGNTPDSDQLFNRTRRNAGFVIRRNQFDAVRRFGTVFRSADGVVTDNDYRGTSNSAITNINEPAIWHNGLASERVLIARNTITACVFDGSAADRASIDIRLNCLGGLAPARLHRQIRIEGNRIIDWSQRAISLQNSADGTVAGNAIASSRRDFLAVGAENHAIFLSNTEGCRVTGNDLRGERRELTGAITLRDNDHVVSADNVVPE